MLKPNAQLFMRLTTKNMAVFGSHLRRGTARGLKKNGGCFAENCEGQVMSAATKNWTNVIRRPTAHCQCGFIASDHLYIYRSVALP